MSKSKVMPCGTSRKWAPEVNEIFPKDPRSVKDGETTIKMKFALLRGVGHAGREGNRSKTLHFVGNATTIKF